MTARSPRKPKPPPSDPHDPRAERAALEAIVTRDEMLRTRWERLVLGARA